jgi:predicted transcriptional regulator
MCAPCRPLILKKLKKTLAKKNDRDYDSLHRSNTPAAPIFNTTANTAHGARCPIGRLSQSRNIRNRTETATAMREHGARWQDLNADDQIRFSSRQDLGRVGTGATRMGFHEADSGSATTERRE